MDTDNMSGTSKDLELEYLLRGVWRDLYIGSFREDEQDLTRKPMNLTTILDRHKNKEIVDHLIELYPDQKKSSPGYRRVLKKLRDMKPEPRNEMKIRVYDVVDDLDPENIEEYTKVSGIENNESYAIEFTPWNQWLGMDFTVDSLKFSEVDLAAHCLWEMTWSGFEEEHIQETYNSLMEAARGIKNDIT